MFKCVTYNVHFGIGMDGRFDLERIAAEVADADVIALQEVCRNHPENGSADMVAGLCELLPGHYHVYGAPFQVDIASGIEQERAVSRYFEFGNMVLSKTPIAAARNHLLPRTRSLDVLNLQRGALEAVITTPIGPVRFYSIHLDHTSSAERLAQIAFLMCAAFDYHLDGGAVTGQSTRGYPEFPDAGEFLLMGDFNLVPDSEEYAAICGSPGPDRGSERAARFAVDVSMQKTGDVFAGPTWFDPDGKLAPKRIDYCFASPGLAAHVTGARVDESAQGSDHRPVWVELV